MARALGLHHITKRKEKFFQRILSWVRRDHDLDDVMIFIAVIYPLSIIPQVVKIVQIQDASSISVISFGLKACFSIPWIYYGIKHKSNPIILSNILWFAGYAVVITEALIF
jgi:uncharacterized protein with PQ loop repeat